MNYKDKIKLFMKLKEKRLVDRLIGYTAGTYYNMIIDKEIDKWKEQDARIVYKDMENYIRNRKANGLKWTTCPFCVKYICFCPMCEYGKINGKCNNRESKLNSISIILDSVNIYERTDIFNNNFYVKLIEEIESEDK